MDTSWVYGACDGLHDKSGGGKGAAKVKVFQGS